jgi:tetratricopeptide (TPR) repeat protein
MKTERNAPCPCGSGMKYKKCCGDTPGAAKGQASFDVKDAIRQAIEHHRSGRIDQARALYAQVLQQQPNHPEALHLLGAICYQLKDYATAETLMRQAIAAKQTYSAAHSNLGNVLKAMGRNQEAVESYNAALALDPDFADAHCNLGNVLREMGRENEAVQHYERALAIRPDYAEVHNNLGNILKDRKQLDDAMAHYRKALALKPDFADPHNNMGLIYLQLDKVDEAIGCYRTALNLNPAYAEAYNNLSNAYLTQGKLKEAVQCYASAIAIRPDYPEAYCNLGNALKDIGELQQAYDAYAQALVYRPNFNEVPFNQSITLLLMGRLKEGWEKYDWRWKSKDFSQPMRPFTQPLWQGEDLSDKTILVWGEQGVGDTIMFANPLADLIATSGHCVVECDKRLVTLFQRTYPSAEVIPALNPPLPRTSASDIDCHIPIGGLARWFRPDVDSFSKRPGFLKPDPQRVAFWKQRLDALGDAPKVGISWRSKHQTTLRNLNYTELFQWSPILGVEGINFVNLQYDDCEGELQAAEAQFGVTIHRWNDIDLMNDLDEVAALTAALDLTIAPNTSVFGMAGAVGTPVWLMNLKNDWGTFGTGWVPWFPSTRIFAKDWDETWEGVIHAVADELGRFAPSAAHLLPDAAETVAPADTASELELAITDGLRAAMSMFQQGQLNEAQTLYGEILNVRPDNVEALQMLGVIALKWGGHDIAADLFSRALAVDPAIPEAHSNLGFALQNCGQVERAVAHYRTALQLKPGFVDALLNLGNALRLQNNIDEAVRCYREAIGFSPANALAHNNLATALYQQGNFEEAVGAYKTAISLKPDYAQAMNNLGLALHDQGKLDDAIAQFEQALALSPNLAEAHFNLANTLKAQGNPGAAVERYERAISIDPNYADAYVNLGNTLKDMDRKPEAIALYEHALQVRPNDPDIHNNLGLLLQNQGRHEEAMRHYEQASGLRPDFAEAYNNFGTALREQGDFKKACEYYQKALNLDPDYAEAYYNLGNIYAEDPEQLNEALACYEQALRCKPGYEEVQWNQSLTLLAMGRLKEGWENYDWRLNQKSFHFNHPPLPHPMFAGESLAGKTVIVWGEQGIGDEILFASCIPDIVAACRHCIVECAPRLVTLFQRSFPNAEVIAWNNPPPARAIQPDIDVQIAMGSLARWFRSEVSAFPEHAAYLVADPARVEFWKSRLDRLGAGLKVGISWRSQLRSRERDPHYTQLLEWESILATPGVTFVNLQYDECAAELAAAEKQTGIKIHRWDDLDLKDDLDEAAALTSALDLVIAPNNSVFGMAGALGKPVWLLNLDSDWSMLGTQSMPWLPSTRVLLKSKDENWDNVIAEIARDLRALTK